MLKMSVLDLLRRIYFIKNSLLLGHGNYKLTAVFVSPLLEDVVQHDT